MSSDKTNAVKSLRPDAEEWRFCVEMTDGRVNEERVQGSLSEIDTDCCVLPVEVLITCPLWFRAADDSVLRGAVRLQLEKRNLLPESSEGTLIAYRIVCREEQRVLLLVTVLSLEQLRSLKLDAVKAARFSVSPLTFELPENAMVVWRELGNNVVAFTRGGELVHFQALLSVDDRSLATELNCLAMRLEAEEVVDALDEVVFANLKVGDRYQLAAILEKQLGLRVRHVTDLEEKNDLPSIDLLPPIEAQRRQNLRKLRRRKKAAMMMAAIYVMTLLALGARLFWRQQAVASSRIRQEFLAGKVADVRQTKQLWQLIKGAVDSDEYPLEILSLCVEAIPQTGVELTDFAINSSGKITLAGQADSIPQALAFKAKLTSQANLSRYDWNFPQPRNRKKGAGAIFKTIGTRNDDVAN